MVNQAVEVRSTADKSNRGSAWRTYSRNLRAEYGVASECRPWTGSGEKRLIGPSTCERYREIMDIAFIDKLHRRQPGESAESVTRGFFVDLSQGVQFKKWGHVEALNRGTPGAALAEGFRFYLAIVPFAFDLAGS